MHRFRKRNLPLGVVAGPIPHPPPLPGASNVTQSPESPNEPSAPGSNLVNSPSLCEECGQRPKRKENHPNGQITISQFCGLECAEAARLDMFPISSLPTPAAASRDAVILRKEDLDDPIAQSIVLGLKENWNSDSLKITKVMAVYSIDFPAKIYRRFDTALQMNNGCTVFASYYAAKAMCGITTENKHEPIPCASESCSFCIVIRSAFGSFRFGAASHDGPYGPGLYTYVNPAQAHQKIKSSTRRQEPRHALIQCRVVTRPNSAERGNSYAGVIDDSGVVFCSQPVSLIPTHLLIFNTKVKASSNDILSAAGPSVLGPPGIHSTQNPGNQDVKRDQRDSPPRGALSAILTPIPAPLGVPNQENAVDVSATGYAGTAELMDWLDERLDEEGDYDDLFVPIMGKPAERGDETPVDTQDDPEDSHNPQQLPNPSQSIQFGESSIPFFDLCNSADYPIAFQRKIYPTGEHLFESMKFIDTRPLIAEHIRTAGDHLVASAESVRFAYEVRPDWETVKVAKMDEVLELKFTQHVKLKRLLLSTGERILVFQNSGQSDDFWGNGTDGAGRNELGLALMRLRTRLQTTTE